MRRIGMTLGVVAMLAGCGDPLKSVQRLNEVTVAEGAGQADVAAPAEGAAEPVALAPEPETPRRGLLGFLKRKADEGSAPAVPPEVAAEAPPTEMVAIAPVVGEDPVAAPAPDESDAAAPRGGLFARLRGGGGSAAARADEPMTVDPDAVDARQVSFGTSVPYGQVARVCDAPTRQLGKRAGTYPERGSRYTLFDSAPGSTGSRSYFLTGFKDGCARQFTAALVLFGSPESYEQIHYGPAGKSQPKAETDAAYERIKSRVCRVGTGKPCGSAMSRLARDTVFVSVYERFDSNPRWKNILLHDGEVVAIDMK